MNYKYSNKYIAKIYNNNDSNNMYMKSLVAPPNGKGRVRL